ncbi:hypothetical protein ACFRCQ_20500 [Cytobacillus firmus]|uniref:Protein involved in plasmid replication-relaxation n=2 Tax=Bacteria TaxID=2 RepID=A0ABX3CL13_9BACI|nr:hypothetical protein [Cytobacillus oceanisediminis]OHX41378.1 hypothetical protein BBV17_28690 [Cytobacillus oceanisediminis]
MGTMPIFCGYKLFPKQIKILDFLFRRRAATTEQITRGLGYRLNYNSKKGIYTNILELKNYELIDSDSIRGTNKHLHYLTEKGHELMDLYNGIAPGHKGKGYDNDLGDFPYDLYKYPLKQTEHFKLICDVYLEVKEANERILDKKKQTNIHSEDEAEIKLSTDEHMFPVKFRDNLYASQNFYLQTDKSKTKYSYKPDSEIKIGEYTYPVEIDRATERGQRFNLKFEGYRRYFDYLSEKELPLPKGIIFIAEEKLNNRMITKRWSSIANRFLAEIGEYSEQVNLYFTSINKLQDLLIREFTFKHEERLLNEQVSKMYGNGDYLLGEKVQRFQGAPQYPISVGERDDKENFNYFVRVEGFQTQGLITAIRFKEFYNKLNASKETDKSDLATPVFYYLFEPPQLSGLAIMNNQQQFFSRAIYFNLATGEYEKVNLANTC